MLLMIETLHGLLYENHRHSGSTIYRGSCMIFIINSGSSLGASGARWLLLGFGGLRGLVLEFGALKGLLQRGLLSLSAANPGTIVDIVDLNRCLC